MRLFIAMTFNNATLARLITLREELRSKSQSGRFSLDDNLHLTLAFIGEVSPNKVDKIKTIMDTITFEPFSAAIERVGRFKRNGGDIWWAGLREDKPLMDLQRKIEHKLALCGFEMGERAGVRGVPERRFYPHITLGREVVTDCKPWTVEPFGETVSHIDLMLSERVDGKLTYTSIYRRGKWTRPIVVEPYNPSWEAAFAALNAKLRSMVEGLAAAIHHVGSTSVPGLAAKPILDVDIEIADMSVFPQIKAQLAKLGYRHEGDYGIEGREAFKYDDSEFMTHHLYVCPSDSAELRRHLRFRDYLRSHPDAVREYGELKQSLTDKYGNDIDAYIDGKTAFIQRCLLETNE
ncbi:hypothetical protein FACS1894208_06020 [Clostridia bacterium]|nr:hypothetical protein FACS1894208_06020 [Clostridia bacterium]